MLMNHSLAQLRDKRVSFSEVVEVRPIPMIGRGRSCRKIKKDNVREKWAEANFINEDVESDEDKVIRNVEKIHGAEVNGQEYKAMKNEKEVGVLGLHTCGIGSKSRWADMDEEENVHCPECAKQSKTAEEWAEVVGAKGLARAHGPAPATAVREESPVDSVEWFDGECIGKGCDDEYVFVCEHSGDCAGVSLGVEVVCRSTVGGKLVEGECEAAIHRPAMRLAPSNTGQFSTDCMNRANSNSYVLQDQHRIHCRRNDRSLCRRGSAGCSASHVGVGEVVGSEVYVSCMRERTDRQTDGRRDAHRCGSSRVITTKAFAHVRVRTSLPSAPTLLRPCPNKSPHIPSVDAEQ